MKKSIIKIAAGAAAILLMSTSAEAGYTMKKKVGDQNTKLTVFGFSQIVAGTGEGYIKDDSDSKVKFGADRIRLGWKYVSGNIRGKVFLDFNQDAGAKGKEDVGMYRVIKDAFISYVVSPDFIVKAGVIKTPVGMGFTIPGWNLDVIKRGFDKKLAFERGNGIMISGRDMGLGNNGKVNGFEMGHERPWKGFGYDVMIANQATRSGAIKESDKDASEGNAYMARLHFDYTELLHSEISYGVSPEASGVDGSEDYKVLNVGIDSHFLDGMNIKAEYYDVSGIKGAKHDMSTLAITYTAYLTDSFEFALKSINGSEDKGGVEQDVGNHYVGFNYYPSQVTTKKNRGSKRKNNQHTIKVNYVAATGDSETFSGAGGVYKDNAILAMYQFKF